MRPKKDTKRMKRGHTLLLQVKRRSLRSGRRSIGRVCSILKGLSVRSRLKTEFYRTSWLKPRAKLGPFKKTPAATKGLRKTDQARAGKSVTD